ncbi:MAG: hypothetical protein R3B70_02615 [Polyangiaceae bacterium]
MGIGPFDDTAFAFGDPEARPRPVTVVIGGACSGKTTLLGALASTRPGHAIAQLGNRTDGAPPGHVLSEWHLGDDDPSRPHPLRVASPNVKLEGEEDDAALVRRREQALYDRRAGEGGFVFTAFSGARWFSRSPVVLTTPDRTILRYDVRSSASFDDASRADLTRETKQALAYASVGAALASLRPRDPHEADTERAPTARLARWSAATETALACVLDGTGFAYDGVDPTRLEPVFTERGAQLLFDDLPRGLRHSIAFVALPLRAMCAAYPQSEPRTAEGVVVIDDAELRLPLAQQRTLIPRLRAALPAVQWLIATASPAVAEGAEVADVIAMRRLPGSGKVEIYDGASAVLH